MPGKRTVPYAARHNHLAADVIAPPYFPTTFPVPCAILPRGLFTSGDGLHARTRGGRGCRSRELFRTTNCQHFPPYTLGSSSSSSSQGVVRTGSLDVSDDRSGLVVHELDADLGNTTARAYFPSNISRPFVCSLCDSLACGRESEEAIIRTGTAEDTSDLHELDGLLGGIHFG